jgi:hypothetical protein
MTREEYEQNAQCLNSMVAERRAHAAENCGGLTCMGDPANVSLRAGISADPRWPIRLVLAAVTMMAGDRERIEELERLLEVQRGMTADAAACAMRVDADLVDAHGQIAGLEQKVAALLAELTVMEESPDASS